MFLRGGGGDTIIAHHDSEDKEMSNGPMSNVKCQMSNVFTESPKML